MTSTDPAPVGASAAPASTGEVRAAGGILTIDLAAIVANYRTLCARTTATCAAVVKADAYGLGAAAVAPPLAAAGCRHFFVAHLDEGIRLRAILGPEPEIAVLHGAPPGTEAECLAAGLLPVLSAPEHIAAWTALARLRGRPLPAILQMDTGMSRFGLSRGELDAFLGAPGALDGIALRLVMSHLACASEPGHPANAAQRDSFAATCRRLPGAPASLSASSGILLGPGYQFDQVRPGAALYGVNPIPGRPNPMRPVIRLQVRIVQLREVAAGTGIGYGHTAMARGPMRLAIVSAGYADGYLRSASGRASAFHGPHRLPVVGRVSMDSIIVDLAAVPPGSLAVGDLVDLVGPHQDVDALGEAAGTIGYEILTSLGARYHRTYVNSCLTS